MRRRAPGKKRGRHCGLFFQAEDGIRDDLVTGVQTCALPISAVGPGSVNKISGRIATGIGRVTNGIEEHGTVLWVRGNPFETKLDRAICDTLSSSGRGVLDVLNAAGLLNLCHVIRWNDLARLNPCGGVTDG